MIDPNNQTYLKAAHDFEVDREVSNEKSKKAAWGVAIGACAIAVAAIACITVMLPLKTVELAVIRVDNATGYTEVIQDSNSAAAMPQENEHKFWLATYVNAREEYSDAQGYANYKRVGLMSTPDEQARYFPKMDPENPKSILNTFGKSGRIEVNVLSITLPDEGVATVRFRKTEKLDARTTVSYWIATISYSYQGLPEKPEDRLLSPRGFMVSEYRVDQENVGAGGSVAGDQ